MIVIGLRLSGLGVRIWSRGLQFKSGSFASALKNAPGRRSLQMHNLGHLKVAAAIVVSGSLHPPGSLWNFILPWEDQVE
jgi:hypothetical protein